MKRDDVARWNDLEYKKHHSENTYEYFKMYKCS